MAKWHGTCQVIDCTVKFDVLDELNFSRVFSYLDGSNQAPYLIPGWHVPCFNSGMGNYKTNIIATIGALILVLSSPGWSIEIPYSAANYCDQSGFFPGDARTISTVTVRGIAASQSYPVGGIDLGVTPLYFSILAAHDGRPLLPGKPVYTYGSETSFIPELTYAIPGKSYLALTYWRHSLQTARPDATEEEAERTTEVEQDGGEAQGSLAATAGIRPNPAGNAPAAWMWGLRGLVEVICLPDPEQACIFLENSIFGRAGDIYLRTQHFCREDNAHRGERDNHEGR